MKPTSASLCNTVWHIMSDTMFVLRLSHDQRVSGVIFSACVQLSWAHADRKHTWERMHEREYMNVIFVQSIGFWLQLFCLPVKPWECFMDFTHSSIVIHSCTRMHFWDKGQRAEEYIQSNKLSPVHSLGHTSVRDLPLSSPQLSVTLHVFCCFIHLKHAHVYFYCSGRDH